MKIGDWLRLFANIIFDGVANNADDFAQARIAMKVEALADGVFVGPEMLGHRFVGDDDLLCAGAVGVIKFAARDERHTESLEECWGYVIHLGQSPAETGGFILTLRENRARERGNQWGSVGNGSGFHTGRGFGALDGSAEKLLTVSFVVMQSAEIKGKHEKIRGFEAGINALCVLHAANEKPSAHECHQSQRNFSNHEHAAERTAGPPDRVAASAHLQDFDQIGTRGLQRRNDSDEHGSEERHAQRKQQDVGIETEVEVTIANERRSE